MNKFSDYLSSLTADKSVCLLGFGREGKATYRMLNKYCSCKKITICDLNEVNRSENNLPEDVEIISGKDYQNSLDRFDMVFKSPGIVLENAPNGYILTSETQVFFEFFRSQIVGITGTKGKSTVSSLIYHILKESGVDCRLAGNIGIPVFDISENISDNTVIVCELSCHQLEYMTVSPHTAVMLNLYEEHLDHYGTMEKYAAAKRNIYLHQQPGDRLFCNYDIAPKDVASTVFTLSNTSPKADFYVANSRLTCNLGSIYEIPTDRIKLLGIHNHYNIAVAFLVCTNAVNADEFTEALCTFNPLPHRLEFVAEKNGVRYYDDSISTACATAAEAVKSVPNAGTILVGGMDRGIDYNPLVEFLSGVQDLNVICMEASGKRIYNIIKQIEFNNPKRVYFTEHLDGAVKLAAEITPKGKSCVLSPAAASYGIFRNFEDRGDAFKKLVMEI